MGRRYNGRDQAIMMEQIELSRAYIDNELQRVFPHHTNWFHIVYRGDNYHFYAHQDHQQNRPSRLTINLAANQIHDEMFEVPHERNHNEVQYFMPDGSLAARVQIVQMNLDLENMPNVTKIYNHFLYFGYDQPQFNNKMIILE